MKFLRKPKEEWVWDISYPLRNPLRRKEKDNALLKWSHHLLKINKQTKNKMKALSLPNKIKAKITSLMRVSHPMMTNIKFPFKDKLKMRSKSLMVLLFRRCSSQDISRGHGGRKSTPSTQD